MNQIFSEFMKLNSNDFVKGLVVAVVSAVLTALQLILTDSGTLPSGEDWKSILNVGLLALISYLLKNFLSNSEGDPLKTEKSTRSYMYGKSNTKSNL
jgi:hypothetical protein